uniref:Disease resistance R13L4/SHOC-2-like LRR domain-containing protein n=1 Tax=Pundamilia nyererei TaxID=303518 RepID=A0A3B4FEI7_9CICH
MQKSISECITRQALKQIGYSCRRPHRTPLLSPKKRKILQVLNLCNNRLTSLPSELGLLNKLQTLNLGLNQLEALPASIGALEELRHIGLSDNRFTRFPGCLLKLKKLESIKMDRNPIIAEKIPTEKPVSISESFYLVKESFLCKTENIAISLVSVFKDLYLYTHFIQLPCL